MKDPILQAVAASIGRRSLVSPGACVLVAHSGGPDSTALLHVMTRLAPFLKITVQSIHFDHALRPESPADADFARRTAAKLGVRFTMERDAAPPSRQVQSGARRARYAFFRRMAQARGGTLVATGHTMDDSVETSIMWMLRGAGPTAFGGIPARRGMFIRPLIDTRKAHLMDWLEREGITCVTDKTNETDKYLRNRIRRHVIPAMEKVAPAAVDSISRLTALCGQMGRAMEALAENTLNSAVRSRSEKTLTLDPAFSMDAPFVFRSMVYKAAARKAGANPASLLEPHLEALDRLVLTGRLGRKLDLPEGLGVELDHGGLTFGMKGVQQPPMDTIPFGCPLNAGAGGGILSVTPVETYCEAEHLAAMDRTPAEAVFRQRRPGDYLLPANLAGRKKLKKFLIDRKTPASIRGRMPVLASGQEVLWIPGLYIAPSIAAGPGDTALARIVWTL